MIAETAEKISNSSTLPQNYNHEYFINGVFILVVATVVCYCFGFTKGYSTWLEQKKILSGDTGISEESLGILKRRKLVTSKSKLFEP